MYGYTKQTGLDYEEAVENAKSELKKEGFGMLMEIDVKATLKKKINIDFDKYVILGACNPNYAHMALLAEREIGLIMPCNVIVYEQDGKVFASSILPTVAMGMIKNKKLKIIAEAVEAKLKKVIDAI